jgi:hypothetical protein
MASFDIAHLREQGQDMIIVPLDSSFGHKSSGEQQQAIDALQASSRSAGLAGTLGILYSKATFKLDYLYNEGLPHCLSRLDPFIRHIASGLGILGLHKFLHYRNWFRGELASYVKGILSDCQIRRSDLWNASFVEDVIRDHTGGRGADVIYDPVGGDLVDLSLKCIAFSGRFLVIGFASGTIPSVQLNRVLLKNIAIVGLHWGAYRQHDPEKIPQAMRELFALYERGLVTPLVSSQYPLARAADALAEIASRRSVGKVLLIP